LTTPNRAVFFDRDGVLNRSDVRDGKPYAPRSVDRFHIFQDAPALLHSLKAAGFQLVVVTNQPDVGNGVVERHVVETMHEKLRQALPVDEIHCCFHAQNDGCECRKPKPGMLQDAARSLDIDLSNSFMIGDRKGDIIAGARVGCYTIFIDRHYNETEKPLNPDYSAHSLEDAVARVLSVRHSVS
jgi:D-glycero-D-manno-heptose 1,7-bisphosphate phosphatase